MIETPLPTNQNPEVTEGGTNKNTKALRIDWFSNSPLVS